MSKESKAPSLPRGENLKKTNRIPPSSDQARNEDFLKTPDPGVAG